MTNAPADLLAFRRRVQAVTGLADPADVGIVGDGAHARTGGYHEGRDVLVSIGRYHPGDQYVGARGEDYSARLARDRVGLTDDASAMDVGASWPHGGRAAWLRWNNLLVAACAANRPEMAGIRAVNYSPDGTQRFRIDREHGWALEDSTDLVDIHTHIEWYRDTANRRGGCFDRLIALMEAAIANQPAPLATPSTTTRSDNDMISDVLPAGFGFDEAGNYLKLDLVQSVPLFPVGDGAHTAAWLWLAGDGALIRVGVHNRAGAWDWHDVDVLFARGSNGGLGLPPGTDGLKIGRKRRVAGDTADAGTVRWTVGYAG